MNDPTPILAAELRLWAEAGGTPENLAAPTASSTAHALSTALDTGLVHARDAVHAYAAARAGITLRDDRDTVTLSAADGEVLIAFDDDGHIERLAFSMGADERPRPTLWSRIVARRRRQ